MSHQTGATPVSITGQARIVQGVNQQTQGSGRDASRSRHYWLYILKLESNKFYVGTTAHANPYIHIAQHQRGFLSARWTKKYKPVETVLAKDLGNVTQLEAERIETLQTQVYKHKYGYQNVRGGKYVKVGPRFFRDEDWKMLLARLFMTFSLGVAIVQLIADRRHGV
jgi:predicted GIY-YIG superfamily endonuclease